jgi:hypothetical protein
MLQLLPPHSSGITMAGRRKPRCQPNHEVLAMADSVGKIEKTAVAGVSAVREI